MSARLRATASIHARAATGPSTCDAGRPSAGDVGLGVGVARRSRLSIACLATHFGAVHLAIDPLQLGMCPEADRAGHAAGIGCIAVIPARPGRADGGGRPRQSQTAVSALAHAARLQPLEQRTVLASDRLKIPRNDQAACQAAVRLGPGHRSTCQAEPVDVCPHPHQDQTAVPRESSSRRRAAAAVMLGLKVTVPARPPAPTPTGGWAYRAGPSQRASRSARHRQHIGAPI